MGRLDRKVALVTGGGSGIGRAAGLCFAREGARVVIGDISVEGGEETARLVRAGGGEAMFIRTDVRKDGGVKALVERVVEAYGRLDCAFNNAGIEGVRALTADYPQDMWDRILAVDLTGVWQCMRYEIPHMLRQGGGAIVNTASVLGLVGQVGDVAYVVAKHGVVGLTRVAALEYAARGIRVNAVCPGYIETPMVMERGSGAGDPEAFKRIIGLHPVGRLGKPEEVAELIVWLCSEASEFVTGAAIPVDGGYLAQ
jgi:NAD(P)-dependent dehydrogenase (short-subunit alcohol dehydrogenase family)